MGEHEKLFEDIFWLFFNVFFPEETEYEYSGSDEEDENRGDDRESR